MKAAVVEKPGILSVREVPEPILGEYDALCEILYATTCTGTDLHVLNGTFSGITVNYPTILGHESIGRIVKLGNKVRNYQIGNLVTRVGVIPSPSSGLSRNWGGFAEFGIARDHWAMKEDGISPAEWREFLANQILPDDFDPAAATMIITWRETFSYITRMGAGYGSKVLILGSGGVGLSFVNHAANLLANQVVLVGHTNRLNIGKQIGATDCFAYDTADLVVLIKKKHPNGFDFIIDAIGKKEQLNRVFPLLVRGGTVGIFGMDDFPNVTVNPYLAGGTFTFFNGGYAEEEVHDAIIRLIQTGRLIAENYYDAGRVYTLEQIQSAFESLRNEEMVKALIKIKKF